MAIAPPIHNIIEIIRNRRSISGMSATVDIQIITTPPIIANIPAQKAFIHI